MREGYAEAMVDAGVWKGRPLRWWHEPMDAGQRGGMSGQAIVDWAYAMAAKYPDHVRIQ